LPLHNPGQVKLSLRTGPKFRARRRKDINPLSGITKYRTVYAPNNPMRQLQSVLLSEVRALNVPLPYATAGRPGANIFSHVRPHIGHQYVVQYDIVDAFDSVRANTLHDLLGRYGPRGVWIAEAAGHYSMHLGGGLITGAASSPELFNLYAAALIDVPLERLFQACGRGDIGYTRYLDDLVFSSEKPIGRRLRTQILDVIRCGGFELSYRKACVSDLAADSHVVINGVGIRLTGETFISRPFRRQLIRMLQKAAIGEFPAQRLAGNMGAFYAAAGDVGWLSGQELYIHQRYQGLLRQWRSDPARVAKRTQRQREYRSRMGVVERSRRRKDRRRYSTQQGRGRRRSRPILF
jgi:hypothetical protein